MRMTVKYLGSSHTRSISSEDFARAYGIEHEAIAVDIRVSREVEVGGELGLVLIESPEWAEVNRWETIEPDPEEVPLAVSPEETAEAVEEEPVAAASTQRKNR